MRARWFCPGMVVLLLLVRVCASDDYLPGVVFVSDDIYGAKYEWPGVPRPGTNHWREGYIYHRATTQHPLERTSTVTRPGRNLYTLIPARPDGVLRRITHLTEGEVFDPEPSYDGQKILFSMRRDGEDWFNLYEIQADGTRLAQLTDGPFHDVSGAYLPDGRIVFVSDRAGYLEEYHEERTETLWIMNGDGSNIHQLTFNPGTVFDPTVLRDGRILFSFWDAFMLNLPGLDKHETYLVTIRPDGAEERLFFGARHYEYYHRERHSGSAYGQATEMPDGTILALTELGPALIDPQRGSDPRDALWPVFPGATTIQLGGATHRVHLSPLGSRSTPYALPDGRFLLSATLPGARDLGIYLCDPRTREMQLIFNDPTTSEFDPRPILLPRPRPAVLEDKTGFAAVEKAPRNRRAFAPLSEETELVPVTGRARFAIVNARHSDNPEHQRALRRARYYRVVEALHTAVTSSSHTNLATRVLGEVPILPDESVYFEAPADTPLYLEPLDAAGQRIEFTWNYPETSVPEGSAQTLTELAYINARAGEVRACHGCHAPQDEAARHEGSAVALTLEPVQVDRDVTDLMYRRNEPAEYRCTARIGDGVRCASWLTNADLDLRRRACEVLMTVEDEGRPYAAAIADLLREESPEVRGAAARALGRLGGPRQAPNLIALLADPDWQVRFHAATALEAITGCDPPAGLLDAAPDFYESILKRCGGVEGLEQSLGSGPIALADLPAVGDAVQFDRWCEAVGRLGVAAPAAAKQIVRKALDVPVPPPFEFEALEGRRRPLIAKAPPPGAVRAAGWLRDEAAVPLLTPWLEHPEYQGLVQEVALSLGRIGTPEAVDVLWQALRRSVPTKRPYLMRYYQHGPRPEEYTMLHALVLAGDTPRIEDVHLIVALLPGTFLEKPRFEDRLRPETQRILLVRLLLERAGLREEAVKLLVAVLEGAPPLEHQLYQQILQGINLERPFEEHRRPFPVVASIEAEQALWLLGCLAEDRSEVPESVVVPYLKSPNHRDRIDAAVLLGRLGFGTEAADVLVAEAAEPYPFKEIMGIGKSHSDPNFRDKCYFVMALAHRTDNVERLRPFADATTYYRDIRYGLATGLGQRGRPDGIPLLSQLAISDPISVIRRQARESLRAIQETERMAGRPCPEITLPADVPFEALYPPRGLTWPAPVRIAPHESETAQARPREQWLSLLAEGLRAEHFRDLNNANNQAPGATRMMVSHIAQLEMSAGALIRDDSSESLQAFRSLIESPYPFAHYLAFGHAPVGGHSEVQKLVEERLAAWAKSGGTVGFYWGCEALARERVESASPVLAKYASAAPVTGTHGPLGMGFGYPAAKALARIAGRVDHGEVQRLLASDNGWLRAGALAGLMEARAPGIEELLETLLADSQPALVRSQAQPVERGQRKGVRTE